MNKNKKDKIYASAVEKVEDFVFDEQVVDVFEDMINRSVPGYRNIISGIGVLSQQYAQDNSMCYDLGCALGASTLAMRQRIDKSGVSIVSVDNSRAMLERCCENIKRSDEGVPVTVVCDDIQNIKIKNASVVVLNFVLQFIAPEQRCNLLKNIYAGMNANGILILSEKIAFEDSDEQKLMVNTHQAFKKLQGYSDLEISQKRTALEKVLIPETLEKHRQRLRRTGFCKVSLWFQCFNFVSMVAVNTKSIK